MAEGNKQNLNPGKFLKKGDYTVHVFLEEIRGISVKGEDNIDVIVRIDTLGSHRYSRVYPELGPGAIVYLGEHFFFNKADMTIDEIQTSNILIQIKNHSILFRDSIVGIYELDLVYVYKQPNHCLRHQWIAISNASGKSYTKVRGYVRLGVSVIHESDEPVDLALEDGKLVDSKVMLPPQIVPKTTQLIITLLKAENLPVMDCGGTIHAYIEAHFAGVSIKSSYIEADSVTMTSYWYEELYMPVIEPCVSHKLVLRVFDQDFRSELVGSFHFEWDDVIAGKYSNYFWTNIYGAPPLISNDYSDIMNNISNLASHWRGRVLLKITTNPDVKKAKLKCEKIADPEIDVFVRDNFEVGEEYELRCTVFSGHAFPISKGKFAITVEWSGVILNSDVKESKNGSVHWNQNLKKKVAYIPNRAEHELPDLFVYLVVNEEKICYSRIKVEDVNSLGIPAKWYRLFPDIAVGKVKNEWEGGLLKLRLFAGKRNKIKSTPRDIRKTWTKGGFDSELKNKVLLCHLYQCKNLSTSDPTGLCDPYVKFNFNGSKIVTQKSEKLGTLNPIWYRSLRIDIQDSADARPPLIVQVWDYDVASADDFIGGVIIDLEDIEFDPSIVPTPKWYNLTTGRSDIPAGEILLSFTLHDTQKVPHYDLIPEMISVTVEINVLGLRDLKPPVGFIPVTKPYIQFDVKSLMYNNNANLERDFSTQPLEHGANPNINAVICFDCKIPIDRLYCPAITCTVIDYILFGLTTPIIGTFTINLSDFIRTKLNTAKELLSPDSKFTFAKKRFAQSYSKDHLGETGETKENLHTDQPNEMSSLVRSGANQDDSISLGFKKVLLTALERQSSSLHSVGVLKIEDARNGKVISYPKFKEDAKMKRLIEIEKPDPAHFMQIGYNRAPNDGKMHYRFYIKTELESSILINDSPFHYFNLVRGKRTLFDWGHLKPEERIQITGKFKGLIRVTPKNKEEAKRFELKKLRNSSRRFSKVLHKNHLVPQNYDLQVTGFKANAENEEDLEFNEISRQLLQKVNVIVNVYIIDAFDLVSLDIGSDSDPYLVLTLGSQVFNEKDSFISNRSDPTFYKVFTLNTTLPGESILKIQVWDRDRLFTDDKIGTTCIDLEDRFFSIKWNKLPYKPIETRRLMHKSYKHPRGWIRLWIDIFKENEKIIPFDISPKPPMEFEARLIVYKSEGIKAGDIEDTSDMYVRAWVNSANPKETDTHFRCTNGRGSWNWRMKFSITLPSKINVVNLQVWDKDVFSSNDFLADAAFEFNELAEVAFMHDLRMKKYENEAKHENEMFWVPLKRKNEKGDLVDGGRLQISFEILPIDKAKSCEVGEGRGEPNFDPYLPPPIGRFRWSLNPFSMAGQMCGPEFKKEICFIGCCLVIIFMVVMMLPMVTSAMIADLLSAIMHIKPTE